MSLLKDRQLLVSPEPPTTVGTVTAATDADFNCDVYFRGETFRCKSAGKNHLALNDLVSFWEIDGIFFCAKYSAGYPTRFKRPLKDWLPTHKYNALLQLMLKNAEKIFTYRLGVVESAASANSLIVECWDGVSREMPVEYSGSVKSSASFSVGEAVVCFCKNANNWSVIGQNDGIPNIKICQLESLEEISEIDFGDQGWIPPYATTGYRLMVIGENLKSDIYIYSDLDFFTLVPGFTDEAPVSRLLPGGGRLFAYLFGSTIPDTYYPHNYHTSGGPGNKTGYLTFVSGELQKKIPVFGTWHQNVGGK